MSLWPLLVHQITWIHFQLASDLERGAGTEEGDLQSSVEWWLSQAVLHL